MFETNGYSTHAVTEIRHRVRETLRRQALGDEPETEQGAHDKPIKVGIPYLGPWNKRLLTLGLQHGVYFAQSNRWTIRRSFPSPKVRQTAAELGGSVYEIKCQCPDGSEKLYVGQTGGPLAKRLKQHERQWKGGTGSFSAHSPAPPGADPASGHQLGLTTAKTIRAEEFYPVRVILEAMQILKLSESGAELIDNPNLRQRDGPRINKSDGVRLSPLWRPLALKL